MSTFAIAAHFSFLNTKVQTVHLPSHRLTWKCTDPSKSWKRALCTFMLVGGRVLLKRSIPKKYFQVQKTLQTTRSKNPRPVLFFAVCCSGPPHPLFWFRRPLGNRPKGEPRNKTKKDTAIPRTLSAGKALYVVVPVSEALGSLPQKKGVMTPFLKSHGDSRKDWLDRSCITTPHLPGF